MMRTSLLFMLATATVALSAPEDWSEPVMIADGDTYSCYDHPGIALYTDSTYMTYSRFWDGTTKVNYLKYNQNGDILVNPTLIIDTPYTTNPKAGIVLNNNNAYIFYNKTDRNIYYIKVDPYGKIIEEETFFASSYIPNSIAIAITIEDNNTIHLLYNTSTTNNYVAYSRWNPDTSERLDIHNIVVDDPRVEDQFLNLSSLFDIAVDSEGNAHIFFNQTLRFEIGSYQLETDEVCWARVDDDSTGEYTSRILSTFYTDGLDDGTPTGTIDDNDVVHVIWGGYVDLVPGNGHYSMDIDGNEISSYELFITSDEWPGTGLFTAQYNNGKIALIGNYQNDRYIYGSLDTNGDIVDDFVFITDVMLDWDYNDRADYIHHNNGFINIVWAEGDDLWYMHNQVGLDAVDPAFRADQSDEGLLLTWREDSSLPSAMWVLERDGDELVELAGEADYAYLDRNVDPGVTYSYTLTVTKPDGEILTFGPVEAAWRDDSQTKLTLDAPYPSPAADSVSLDYTLPEGCTSATISVYDLAGRGITTLDLDPTPGRHSLVLDVEDYPPGTYLARLDADATTTTRRFVISR